MTKPGHLGVFSTLKVVCENHVLNVFSPPKNDWNVVAWFQSQRVRWFSESPWLVSFWGCKALVRMFLKRDLAKPSIRPDFLFQKQGVVLTTQDEHPFQRAFGKFVSIMIFWGGWHIRTTWRSETLRMGPYVVLGFLRGNENTKLNYKQSVKI